MKVAISIPDELFQAVDRLAKLNKVSRSRIFVQAVREHLKRMESRQILGKLNEAWSEPMSDEEEAEFRFGEALSWEAIERKPRED
jgi:metal-responsive CopG/Arc/MetJ family transcriptional regulator